MTGRSHAPPDPLQQYEYRLACPFAKSDPERYTSAAASTCRAGFKELRGLPEHIWRKHTSFFRCGFCPATWNISFARREVTKMKEQHWATCEGKRHGTPYLYESGRDDMELLDWDQQRRFELTKSIKNNDDKLKALYDACDKPLPDSYYITDNQPDPEFWRGFTQPSAEGQYLQPGSRTTARNVSRRDAQATHDNCEVSGANMPPDAKSADSGYVSNYSPANGHPFQQQQQQQQQHEDMCFWPPASSHGDGGAAPAVTPGSGEIRLDIDLYPELECFRYSVVDTSSYDSAGLSPSHSRHQALLGLDPPGPGEADFVDPMLWGVNNFEVELLEHPGDQASE
ncbi:hypothetical protein KVR01_000823 [Diaporthe batatas]|uniref:uncharacterized protein n=1 Tax=Diaporthe batatas TaxID=748121 RepID=UPI001D0594B6|nr:uncharacterized protein KVR01_000823 [Diaporthe batatas]KAG8170078.1 hypothetical protein KVR01_000823 [Diaporthe batatas]